MRRIYEATECSFLSGFFLGIAKSFVVVRLKFKLGPLLPLISVFVYCLSDLVQGSTVPVIEKPPNALDFLRNWVMPNKPVLINHAIDHWDALSKWSNDYLRFANLYLEPCILLKK